MPLSIPVPEDLASQLPSDLSERREVLVLGIREWKIRRALEAYRRRSEHAQATGMVRATP